MSSELREIRINPIVPSESVLVATARGNRPKKAEELAPQRFTSACCHLSLLPWQ